MCGFILNIYLKKNEYKVLFRKISHKTYLKNVI